MAANSFFNGISPSLYYSSILYNGVFGAKISPAAGLPQTELTTASQTVTKAGAEVEALNGLYNRQYDILAKADALSTANSSSVFYQKTAESSDAGVVDVSYFNEDNYSGQVPDSNFEFDVTSTARSEINMGQALAADANSAINAGTNQFTLTVNGTDNYNISFEVGAGDNNQTALESMVQAVNDADSGVTASVEDAGNGNIQIKLTGQTGAEGAFSLANVSGNALSATGLDQVGAETQSAQNAVFTVNGASYDQANNAVLLMNGKLAVEVTGAGQSTITVEPDAEAVVEAVDSLVSAMNDLTSYLASNQYISGQLGEQWQTVVNTAGSLTGLGFDVSDNGQLSLEAAAFTNALLEDWEAAREAIGGIGGLTSDIKAFSHRVTNSPGASLLMSPTKSWYVSMTLRSMTSAPSFRRGSSTFQMIA